jgi:hypothetical protein
MAFNKRIKCDARTSRALCGRYAGESSGMRRGLLVAATGAFFYFFLCLPASALDSETNEMGAVTGALESVVKECIQYSLDSAAKFEKLLNTGAASKLPDKDKKELVLDNYNSLLKTCLQVGALKLNQAAESIGIK